MGANLLQALLYFAIFFALAYICMTIYIMTPMGENLIALLEPIVQPQLSTSEMEAMMTPEFISAFNKACTPIFIIIGILWVLAAIPVFYRLRFAHLSVMDGHGPLTSLLQSNQRTRHHCFWIFKLDLHFWRFYLLLFLCLLISYGDTVCRLLGVTLPFSRDVAFFLFFGIGALCQGLLLWRYQAPVLTAYALAYLHGPYPPSEETVTSEA